ncbi:MAG: hypothetical protein ABIM89_18285 [Mycobacteriales bacterium]
MSVRSSVSGFVVIGTTGPAGGMINVYVDGVLIKRVNTYSAVTRVRQQLFVSNLLAANRLRTLRLVAARVGPRTRIVVDAIALVR